MKWFWGNRKKKIRKFICSKSRALFYYYKYYYYQKFSLGIGGGLKSNRISQWKKCKNKISIFESRIHTVRLIWSYKLLKCSNFCFWINSEFF